MWQSVIFLQHIDDLQSTWHLKACRQCLPRLIGCTCPVWKHGSHALQSAAQALPAPPPAGCISAVSHRHCKAWWCDGPWQPPHSSQPFQLATPPALQTMTSRPAAKKRHFAPTKGCPLAVLQWADVETSDPKRQRRLVDMSPVRQVPKKLMQSAAPAPASPQAAAEPQKGFPPKPSPGAEQAQAEQAQEAPSKQLLVPGAALQQGQQGKQPPASTARTAASGLWPSASESDSEAPAGTVDFASDEDAEKSAPGPQTQQLLARFDSDSEADTDAQPKDPGGGALLWLGPAAMRGGHQMLKGSTSESDAEYQHPELPEPQGQPSPEQPAAKGIPDSDTSSGQSDLTEKRELMADHDQAAITNPADEQASDASPCPETPGGSEQVAAPEAGGLDFAEQQQADGANSEASIEIPAVLQWWQDPGGYHMQC